MEGAGRGVMVNSDSSSSVVESLIEALDLNPAC